VEYTDLQIPHGTTDAFRNLHVVLHRYKTAVTSVWVTTLEHSLALPVNVTAIAMEHNQLPHRLSAQTLHNIYTNVGFVVVVGQYHTAMVVKVL
jgi:hypothetical protein